MDTSPINIGDVDGGHITKGGPNGDTMNAIELVNIAVGADIARQESKGNSIANNVNNIVDTPEIDDIPAPPEIHETTDGMIVGEHTDYNLTVGEGKEGK